MHEPAKHIVRVMLIALSVFPAAAVETDGPHDKLSQVLKAHVKDGVMDYDGLKSDQRFFMYLDEQLENSAVDFINDPVKHQFDTDLKITKLSKITDWSEGDFAEHSGSVQKYVSQYAKDRKLADELDPYPVKHPENDWDLSGTYKDA